MNHDDTHDLGLEQDLKTMAAMAGRRTVLRWMAGAALMPLVGCGTDHGQDGDQDDPSSAGDTSADASATGPDAGAPPSTSGGSTGTSGAGKDAGSVPGTGSEDASAGATGSSASADASASGSADSGATNAPITSCSPVPEETQGPFPGDGSNGANALTVSGVVRSDVRSSFGGATGTAAGVTLTLNFTLVNSKDNCKPLAGYAIYIWHCDREGLYSMYSSGATDRNYLRGVQVTDQDGSVSFTSIFPACYTGRWPHVHFEIYADVSKTSSAKNKLRTSQLALPERVCNTVFATPGYESSVTNMQKITLASDMVFSDGATLETPEVTGNVASGYVSNAVVGLAV